MNGNKTQKRKTGDTGEILVAKQLVSKGYSIVARNYSCRQGELDIVAVKDDIIAFVEVKTRSGTAFGLPCEAVNHKKQQKLRNTAGIFMKFNRQYSGLNPRMDIAEVYVYGKSYRINLIENAF